MKKGPFPEVAHEVDFCVVGGGMAGLVAALSAARHGIRVALVHDRPVLGGNASSECRVHICGADRHNYLPGLRETGILEEIRMENLHRNSQRSFGVWDTLLYEKARYQSGLTLLLNCSVQQAKMRAGRIASVTGWQCTTETRQTVKARLFADCSGDGVLAPLTGAAFRVGREARSEYGESAAPEVADRCTMGMSICFQTRLHDRPQPFHAPHWAYRFEKCDDLPYGAGGHAHHWEMGYWWVELGGEQDSIHDAEALKDELLRIALGVWDHIKNHCENREAAANWALDWMQFLPAKRESRRYVGAHVLTQSDILAEGRFDDLVAYGGWTMDDHPPHGFWGRKRGSTLPSAVHHQTPSPYGIPYRSLYARDIPNLLFAGRCHSASHLAMSSTRVMGTGCSMGHAVGAAAAMLIERKLNPAALLPHIRDLQQRLLRDDAYLPWVPQVFGPITSGAALTASKGDPEPVRDGINRPVGGNGHAWSCRHGDWIQYSFAAPTPVREASLILDSCLELDPQMSFHCAPGRQITAPPPRLPRVFRVDLKVDGRWRSALAATDNNQRLVRVPVRRPVEALRYVFERAWAADESRVLAFYVD